MKTTDKKKTKELGISLQDHTQRLRKSRPDLYEAMKNPDPHISLGMNVAQNRHKMGLTQIALAGKAGVAPRTIQNIENVNSRYNPTLDVITAIAKVFSLLPEDLIRKVDLTQVV